MHLYEQRQYAILEVEYEIEGCENKEYGWVHGFFQFKDGEYSYPVAVFQYLDGSIDSVPVERIRLVDRNEWDRRGEN